MKTTIIDSNKQKLEMQGKVEISRIGVNIFTDLDGNVIIDDSSATIQIEITLHKEFLLEMKVNQVYKITPSNYFFIRKELIKTNEQNRKYKVIKQNKDELLCVVEFNCILIHYSFNDYVNKLIFREIIHSDK